MATPGRGWVDSHTTELLVAVAAVGLIVVAGVGGWAVSHYGMQDTKTVTVGAAGAPSAAEIQTA
ncbi:MAG TPA: hypothetical protein VFI01_03210, partial [Gaiellaceae bacterium]|nr:hypothetical protein [Gaiellaceae bacterium]